MAESFVVRRAEPGDLDLILQMIREMASSEQLEDYVTVTRESLERNVFGSWSIAEVFLGFWDDEPVAYLMTQARFSSYAGDPILYVEDTFVRARAQGRGLGKQLMAYAAAMAQQRGCSAVHWSVGEWNKQAQAFGERIGGVREIGRVHYKMDGTALATLAAGAPR